MPRVIQRIGPYSTEWNTVNFSPEFYCQSLLHCSIRRRFTPQADIDCPTLGIKWLDAVHRKNARVAVTCIPCHTCRSDAVRLVGQGGLPSRRERPAPPGTPRFARCSCGQPARGPRRQRAKRPHPRRRGRPRQRPDAAPHPWLPRDARRVGLRARRAFADVPRDSTGSSGFGDSEKPSPARYAYNIESFTESMADLLAAFEVGRVHVMGHSMAARSASRSRRSTRAGESLDRGRPALVPVPAELQSEAAALPHRGAVHVQAALRSQHVSRILSRRRVPESVPFDVARVDEFYDKFNTPAARESATRRCAPCSTRAR